jgi:hypothetical protein
MRSRSASVGVRACVAGTTLAVIAGCGGTSPATGGWTEADCRTQTGRVIFGADQMLLHYGQQSYYPPDVAYLQLRNSVTRFRNHGCVPEVLGTALTEQLTKKQLRELLSHLPEGMVRYLHTALRPK